MQPVTRSWLDLSSLMGGSYERGAAYVLVEDLRQPIVWHALECGIPGGAYIETLTAGAASHICGQDGTPVDPTAVITETPFPTGCQFHAQPRFPIPPLGSGVEIPRPAVLNPP